MQAQPFPRRWSEAVLVCVIGAALATILTYPFATQMDHVGRYENSDGQFSIWNVAWVARTVVANPRQLLNANIFYPHQQTLAFSELNLAAGLLAVPVYWATRNPYLSLNVVFLATMVLGVAGAYYLVRYLTNDRRAAMVAGICFGFCPYIFGRTSHIQLLLTAGLPLSLLAFHRLADRPTWTRAVVMGLAVAAQATASGYYAILTALIIGVAAIVIASTRRLWTTPRYWGAIALAGGIAMICVLPLFLPYLRLQRETGFSRALGEAALYSADWRAYFASSAAAHQWMQQVIGHWQEVLFPGFLATVAGTAGIAIGWREGGQRREIAILYTTLGALACWASFGPAAGLYGMLYRFLPLLAWLRAPARFGLVVTLALSVLAGMAISALLARVSRANAVAALLALIAAAELATPLRFREVTPFAPAYGLLATLPAGPVIELPFLSRDVDLHGHAKYLLRSTTHWMPLINGYSDYIPPDFAARAKILRGFPSREAFDTLADAPPRYAVFHPLWYQNPDLLKERIGEFASCLRPLYTEGPALLYEVLDCPTAEARSRR